MTLDLYTFINLNKTRLKQFFIEINGYKNLAKYQRKKLKTEIKIQIAP